MSAPLFVKYAAIILGGYDDDNFHANVIPKMKCKNCDKQSPDNYRPLRTKYEAWEEV